MRYRPLGKTGLNVSVISFGAGPVSGLMTSSDAQLQETTIARAIQLGINWFDTASGYGNGSSERNLGRALAGLAVGHDTHVATKVRLTESDLADVRESVRRSVFVSEERLARSPITLLQLHNSITERRGDEPTSITPADVLGPGGILDVFEELKRDQVVSHIGLTGIGQADALREVISQGSFETIQTPYSLLNRSAGESVPSEFSEANYGQIIRDCASRGIGVLAIRVFAAGALLGNAPSAHTRGTPFFPLSLYERDQRRAARLRNRLGACENLRSIALQYVLANVDTSTAIIGMGSRNDVEQACDDTSGLMSADVRAAIDVWQAEEHL